MKTPLLLYSAALMGTLSITAQPTITSTGVGPVIGDKYVTGMCNYISPGSGGASQTWNLSTLTATSTTTTNIVNPSSTPYGSSFPTANICSYDGAQYAYSFLSNTKSEFLGARTGTVTFTYTDPEELMHFPFTYGNTYTDAWSANFVNMGYTYYRKGTTTVTADGYGTLITPTGTYTNVLRIHITQIYSDSANISGYPVTANYYNDIYLWLTNGIRAGLASVSNFTSSVTSPYQYASYLINFTTGIDEISNNTSIKVFPNPASDEVHVSLSDIANYTNEVDINISDISGKVIKQFVAVKTNTSTKTLPVNDLEPGVYILSIKGPNTFSLQKNIIINHQ